jgi:Amt family ammonium transporter
LIKPTRRIAATFTAAAWGLLALPSGAFAAASDAASNAAIDTLWVLICAFLVIFMLAGFAALEVGLVRGKNAGSIVAKVVFGAAVATLAFWASGFAIGFGGDGPFAGTHGFFLSGFSDPLTAFPAMAGSDASIYAKFLFQYGFAAVVLMIALGPLVERVKFIVYLAFGLLFCGLIYPIAAHWVYGGGFLQQWGMEDFAGSTAVHVVGAVGGLAGVLLLGPRRGKYRDGVSRPLPGHSMPMFGLGILILWFGWFGFNAGSTFQALGVHFAEVAVVTNLSVACGVAGATITNYIIEKDFNIAMIGNGAIAGAVAITAPSGYISPWAAVPTGLIGGAIVVLGLNWIDDKLDDPIGAVTAHGMVGVWGTIAVGLFALPKFAQAAGVGVQQNGEFVGGLVYSGSFKQLAVQLAGVAIVAAFVFACSLVIFGVIKRTIGLRVEAREEDEGLDITDHGMYGYPEVFIPPTELADPGLATIGIGGGTGYGASH